MMSPDDAVTYALQNLYTPVLPLTITDAGGSAQGQQYFEVPYLVRAFRTEYYPTGIVPTPYEYSFDTGTALYWNQTMPSKENFTYSMTTEQNNFTYVGANNPAPVELLNDTDCLWWVIPYATKININVQHTATLAVAVNAFPVVFKFSWIGYRLTEEIVKNTALLFSIINTLKY